MGYRSALDMAAATDRETALAWHLRHNHYPPVPLSMVATCRQALEAVEGGEDAWEYMVELPEGVSWRGLSVAPAGAIIEGHHLDAFLVVDDD